MEQKIGISE